MNRFKDVFLPPLLLACFCCAPFRLDAQACTSRGIRTVDEAQAKLAAGGSLEESKTLLETAGRECSDSPAVLRRIAETYTLLGDALDADRWAKRAAALASLSEAPSKAPEEAANAAVSKSYVREKYALVVGIGNFESRNINALKYSAKDAEDFARVLTDPAIGRFAPANVKVLTDSGATSAGIRSALEHIAREALEDDLVVLYFSTHGSSPSMDRSKAGAGYLVTYDTLRDELYSTAYGMDELARFIHEKLRAKRVVTFLDTCYSGDTGRFLRDPNAKALVTEDALPTESIARVAQGEGDAVITSSSNQEMSWESDDQQNSFFTIALMQSLRQRHGLGNLRELFTDVQRNLSTTVKNYTKAKGLGPGRQGFEQTPEIFPMTGIPDIVIGAATEGDK